MIELARGGTLCLNEIGEASLRVQAKLLQVLEEKKVRRIGGGRAHAIDFRLITVTNQDLPALVEQGRFRQDLFYRINAITVSIPPLREHTEDIPALVEYFLPIYGRRHNKCVSRISDEALKQLLACDWPGNVRQLLYVLEVAVAFAQQHQTTLQAEDFSELPEMSSTDLILTQTTSQSTAVASDMAFIRQLQHLTLEEIEDWVIRQRLRTYQGNITKAAESLGKRRDWLYRWRKRHRRKP